MDAFLADTHASLENIRAALQCLTEKADDHDAIYEAMRLFHSLKSSSAMMGFQGISDLCHAEEETFRAIEQGTKVVDASCLTDAVKIVESIHDSLQRIKDQGPDSLR